MGHPDTICYNLKTFFGVEPCTPANCPSCYGCLEKSEVDNSVMAREFYQNACIPGVITVLIRCRHCGWWAIREQLSEYESAADNDFLVTVKLQTRHPSSEKNETLLPDGHVPWQKILAEKTHWINPVTLSFRNASRLFGSQEAILKKRGGQKHQQRRLDAGA